MALADLQQGIQHYQQEQNGLGVRFSVVINSTFEKIQSGPFAASIAYDEVRYKTVHKFPFVILYKVQNDHIEILRIFNTRQRPVY